MAVLKPSTVAGMELLRGAAALPRHMGVRERADTPRGTGGGGLIMSILALFLSSYPQERKSHVGGVGEAGGRRKESWLLWRPVQIRGIIAYSMISETKLDVLLPSKSVVQDVGIHLDHGGRVLLGLVRFGARGEEDVVDDMSAGLAGWGCVSQGLRVR